MARIEVDLSSLQLARGMKSLLSLVNISPSKWQVWSSDDQAPKVGESGTMAVEVIGEGATAKEAIDNARFRSAARLESEREEFRATSRRVASA